MWYNIKYKGINEMTKLFGQKKKKGEYKMKDVGRRFMTLGAVLTVKGVCGEGIMRVGVIFGIAFVIWGFCIIQATKEEQIPFGFPTTPLKLLSNKQQKKLVRELFWIAVSVLALVVVIGSVFVQNQPIRFLMFTLGIITTVLALACFEDVRQGKKNTQKRRRRS